LNLHCCRIKKYNKTIDHHSLQKAIKINNINDNLKKPFENKSGKIYFDNEVI